MTKPTCFSNHTEYEIFAYQNCDRCKNYVTPDESKGEDWGDVTPCPIEAKIAQAAFDRDVWPADDLEGDEVGRVVKCKGFEVAEEGERA